VNHSLFRSDSGGKSVKFPLDSRRTFIVQENIESYFRDGAPEEALIQWAAHEFSDLRKSFIDIGAHVGSWTITLAPKFAHAYSFEPQRDPFYCLCGGVALSGLSEKVTARQMALGEPGGPWEAVIRAQTPDGGTGSIVRDVKAGLADGHHETVHGARLDDFEFSNVGLVKIDVEGAELDVWKGAKNTLISHGRPPVFFECWADERGQRRDELFAWVKAFGYDVHPIAGYDEMLLAVRK
jgi:FkbM family methyltransferase